MSKKLIIGILLSLLGYVLVWFQINAQFFNEFCKKYPIIMSLLGAPISYIFLMSTKYIVEDFSGLIWPGKLISSAIGTIVFAILAALVMQEHITLKTGLTILLSLVILTIQIFMK